MTLADMQLLVGSVIEACMQPQVARAAEDKSPAAFLYGVICLASSSS